MNSSQIRGAPDPTFGGVGCTLSASAMVYAGERIMAKKNMAGEPTAPGVEAPKKQMQSPVIKTYDLGEPGVSAVHREDGTITIVSKTRGLAMKVVTMFPLQWKEFARFLPRITGGFDS